MVVDALGERLKMTSWKTKDGARQTYDSQRRIVLAEPQTYMNNSGVPLRIIASWYRTPPEALLVVYDDMDLPFGKMRMRPFGGHGGHNGMRSIIATMTEQFPRIRVGVGRPALRQAQDDEMVIDHVLNPFTPEEQALLPKIVDAAVEGVERWLSGGIEAAMQFVNNLQVA